MIECITANFDWLSFGTLLVTFFTACATFGTVLEIKKQREQSYMPDLLLRSDKRFYLYRATSTGNIQYWYWHETNLQEANLVETIAHYSFSIDCINIGIGTAKNLKFKYYIDTAEMKSFIESLGSVSIERLELDKDVLAFNAKFGNLPLGTSVGKIDLNLSHLFIPEKSENAFKLKLPMIYLSLFNAFILSVLNKESIWEYFNKFPPINLQVFYQDIANKTYSKKFRISIKVDSATINTDRAPSNVSGIILIEAIT